MKKFLSSVANFRRNLKRKIIVLVDAMLGGLYTYLHSMSDELAS